MIIRRATVTNFACLRGPVSIAFGPGLNVIHGPNETGKTTFLRAIRWALMMRAKSTIYLDTIRPRDGSYPEVELHIERGGTRYHLHKHFRGANGSASLQITPASGPPETLTDDAAEQRLRDVMGVDDPGTNRNHLQRFMGIWPLIWVEQGRSGRAPSGDLSDRGREELGQRLSALSGEVLAGQGGEGLMAAVEAEYGQFWTANGSETRAAKAPIVQVRARVESLQAAAAILAERQERYSATLDRFTRVERAMQELAEQLPRLQQRRDSAEAASKALESLMQKQERLRAAVDMARLQAQNAADAREARAQARADIAAQETHLAERAQELGELDARLLEQRDSRPPLQAALAAAKETLIAADRWLDRLRAHGQWLQLDEQIRGLEVNLEKARGHRDRCLALKARIDAAVISGPALKKLQEFQAAAREAEAALQALATALTLHPERDLTLTLDQTPVPLQAGRPTRLVLTEPRSLYLDGLRVEITPGGADLGDRRDRAAAARAEFANALRSLGVETVDAAAEMLVALDDWKRELRSESQMYTHFAPGEQGFDRLESDVAGRRERLETLAARVADLGHADDPAMPTDAAALDLALAAAQRARRDAAEQADAAREALAAQDRRIAEAAQRAGYLRDFLADAGGKRDRAQAALAAAEASAGDDHALSARATETAVALADQQQALAAADAELRARQPQQVALALDQATRALANAERERDELRTERIRLEAELENHELVGLHERLAAAQAERDEAAAELAALERRAAAARLLYDTLSTCRDAARQRYLEPLRLEAGRLLQLVFPGAALAFKDDFDLDHLQRADAGIDAFDQLSGGGKEQLGLVIRLAMANVLAQNEPLAVMFDDALVSCDDERYDRMALLLQLCAEKLQIILATCHWSRYRALGIPGSQTTDLAALLQRARS